MVYKLILGSGISSLGTWREGYEGRAAKLPATAP